MIDSGAFSAFNSGKPVDLDDYCRFLDAIADLEPLAVQLDVIGDPKATWKNFATMRKRGYRVMPVFTRGSPGEMLEHMYATADYILLGGMVGRRDNLGFLKWVMKRINGRKVHWLGLAGNIEAIKLYRPTSVDATSWISTSAMSGLTLLYVGGGRMKGVARTEFIGRTPSLPIQHAFARIGMNGDEIAEFKNYESWRNTRPADRLGSAMIRASVTSHILRALDIEQHTGTKIYFACGGVGDFDFLFRCRERLKEKGLT